jgi:POT family proton-dependent oligopeptide transporter
MTDLALPTSARRDKAFLGHPAGLGWLSFAEFWERFSYYGMQALLVLYMTHWLLLPGHVEQVLGFGPFRSVLQSIYGVQSPQALASAIFGLYAGLVYLTPIAGGYLADRWIGRTKAVALGASLMALGHFLMAFEASFLLALLCLLIGVGCFKGNISSQLGALYADDDPRRGDAFQIFLLSVQIAVIASPFVCGTLGEVYGWHWGFGAAGVGMLLGLVVYLIGRSSLPPEPPRGAARAAEARAPLTHLERRNVWILIGLVPVLAMAMVGNNQIFNAYLIWGEANYQLMFFGKQMPITWILSFGSIISSAAIVASVAFWRWWARRWAEPDELLKIAIGVVLGALAPLLLVVAALIVASTGQRVGLGWAVAFEIVNDIAFANVFPIGLALYSRAAPKGTGGMLIGVYFLHLFIANLGVGWLGGLLEKMPGSAFWLLHAAIICASAVILLMVRFTVGRSLAPAYKTPSHEPAPTTPTDREPVGA